jgi:hypothetical protein
LVSLPGVETSCKERCVPAFSSENLGLTRY